MTVPAPPTPPRGSESKLERATEHVTALSDRVSAWLATDAFTIVHDTQSHPGYTVLSVRLTEEPPAGISLLLGDAVHNLRAALDHVVYEIAVECAPGHVLPPQAEQASSFPIIQHVDPETGRKRFDGRALTALAGCPPEVRARIEAIQPYHHREAAHFHALWQIHELDRIDKHRRLSVTAAALSHLYLGAMGDVDPKVSFAHAGGHVVDGTPLVAFSDAEHGVTGHYNRVVALDEHGMPEDQDLLEFLGAAGITSAVRLRISGALPLVASVEGAAARP